MCVCVYMYMYIYIIYYFKGRNVRRAKFREPKKSRNFWNKLSRTAPFSIFREKKLSRTTTFHVFRGNKLSRRAFCGKKNQLIFLQKILSHAHISKNFYYSQ